MSFPHCCTNACAPMDPLETSFDISGAPHRISLQRCIVVRTKVVFLDDPAPAVSVQVPGLQPWRTAPEDVQELLALPEHKLQSVLRQCDDLTEWLQKGGRLQDGTWAEDSISAQYTSQYFITR